MKAQLMGIEEQDFSCQFENLEKPFVVEGPVIVTRSPCHLTSDIQQLVAVNNEAIHLQFLHDQFNVVVFSSKGDRP